MRDLVLIGGGEHARVIAEAAAAAGAYTVLGFVDPNPYARMESAGVRRLGDDRALQWVRHASLVIAFGSLGPADRRAVVAEAFEQDGWTFATVVDPRAAVSPTAQIGAGSVVLAGAVVQTGARIGRHCVVGSGAVVEHDVRLGDHVQVAPRGAIGGGTTVGARSFIGLGAGVRDHIRLGDRVTVAMGAAVTQDVDDGRVVAGVPARPLTIRPAMIEDVFA